MDQSTVDPSLALNELTTLLSGYSESYSAANFLALLDGLEMVIAELQAKTRREQRDRTQKRTPFRYNRGTTKNQGQDTPNVQTRSSKPVPSEEHQPVSTEKQEPALAEQHQPVSIEDQKPVLTEEHESFSTEEQKAVLINDQQPIPAEVQHENLVAKPSDQPQCDLEPTINGGISIFDKQTELAKPGREGFAAMLDAKPVPQGITVSIKERLAQKIAYCIDFYHGKHFIVNGDDRSETVNPDEINDFFGRFREGQWLSNFNLMPLLYSFDWPSTTLVLHSSYTCFDGTETRSQQSLTKKRWPLSKDHDRIILPRCSQEHWTLYDVDLKTKVIRQYNSLSGSAPTDVVSMIEERLANAMEGQEGREINLAIEPGASQKQQNGSDCGIYMLYNADCIASNRNHLTEIVDGVQLRYRYLDRLVELERQGRSERQVLDMILPSNQALRIKKRQLPNSLLVESPEESQHVVKKSLLLDWKPPAHLGPQEAWVKEREKLADIVSQYGYVEPEDQGKVRAAELLPMIEAIGCEEVMEAWDQLYAHRKANTESKAPRPDSTAQAICQLVERAQMESFKDKVLSRIGKWVFTLKIVQDVENLRKEGAPSKQNASRAGVNGEGNAVTRALTKFMNEICPALEEPRLARERERQSSKYRKWWRDGQIWVLLCRKFGATILLLIPGGQRTRMGYSVSTQQFVEIRSRERDPFVRALQELRPDLKETLPALQNQLDILKDDIANLLGKLPHMNMFQNP